MLVSDLIKCSLFTVQGVFPPKRNYFFPFEKLEILSPKYDPAMTFCNSIRLRQRYEALTTGTEHHRGGFGSYSGRGAAQHLVVVGFVHDHCVVVQVLLPIGLVEAEADQRGFYFPVFLAINIYQPAVLSQSILQPFICNVFGQELQGIINVSTLDILIEVVVFNTDMFGVRLH